MKKLIRGAAMIVAAGMLSGCLSSGSHVDPMTTGSLPAGATAMPSVKETARLGQEWRKNPGDVRKGLAYAERLARLGQRKEQLAVLEELVRRNPRNADLRNRFGKALLMAGRPVPAEREFRAVIRLGRNDWKAHNALGSALAAQGRYAEARREYATAMKLSPGNPKVANNIGMSYILEGKPAEAEKILRTALEKVPQESLEARRLRQNLALAVGLQGRFREARYIASQDLSPEEVEANISYIRRMLGGGNVWEELKKG
jgi:Flp pilus assembly protein TadD